ncbi:cell division protein FtsQ/DivIB [Patescibacteria group bacterium]
MAFFKKKKRRRGKAKTQSRIQEIRSPYSHRKLANKKLPKKSRNKRYSGELKLSHKHPLPLKKWLILGVTIIAVVFALYMVIFTNFFQLRQWKIYGDDIIQEESKFEEFLAVHKDKNLAFLDTGKIESNIKSQYPEIKNLKLKKVFPDTLIMEYENFSEVANVFNLVEDTQKKFVINEIGLLVQQDFENPNLPYIKIRTEKVMELNEFALPREKLEYVLDSIYDFEDLFGMKVLDAEYKLTEREVHIKTDREFIIWLDTALTTLEQYDKLKKALPKLNIYNDSLEYIDLRISSVNGQRVIFKRR